MKFGVIRQQLPTSLAPQFRFAFEKMRSGWVRQSSPIKCWSRETWLMFTSSAPLVSSIWMRSPQDRFARPDITDDLAAELWSQKRPSTSTSDSSSSFLWLFTLIRPSSYNPASHFVETNPMPVGTAFHERTFPLCQSLNYREWSGYYTVSVYEVHHEHEYNAIRNAAALIDITPLYKYRVTGKDATKLVNRVITRNINKVKVGQVIYCCWCDEEGKVIDDGTISRLGENTYRWTAADPSLRWFRQNGLNMDVQIEDISEKTAAQALQGPTSGKLLKAVAEADIANLKYFRVTSGKIAGVSVDISRTGYTGDLGYEIWVDWTDAVKVWDALMDKGKQFDIHPAGMLALDVARVEAGLLLIEVDYTSSKKALIPSQKYSPYELGFAKMVHLEKENFVGKAALEKDH